MIRKLVKVEASGGFPESKGVRYVGNIVSKEELNGHGRLFAHTVLPSGSSVGWHQHVHDTEPYYILKGEGDFFTRATPKTANEKKLTLQLAMFV